MSRRSASPAPRVRVALGPARHAAPLGLLTFTLLGGLACDEEFADTAFGALELETVFPGGTPRNPTAGLPDSIDPQGGFERGARAEYYDFGPVTTQVSTETGAPTAARVYPMYFFFTPEGHPLLGPALRERRDGTDHIRGGHEVRDPNPKDFCNGPDGAPIPGVDPVACRALNDAAKRRPYAIRYREVVVDPLRQSSDFQRPIVDKTPADQGGLAPYTGLWEIVEVTVPSGYRPDAIKHKKTLDRAIASGRFRARPTGKVINCPIVDERTATPPGVTARDGFHPRIELWYRRKLTFCFLANGWPTLGTPDGRPYPANSDAQRLDTFDVSRSTVGSGKTQQSVLLVPVGRAYEPSVLTSDNQNRFNRTRVANQIVASGRPRRTPADPPGYTPIRWMWDVLIEGTFVPDSFQDESQISAFQAVPRRPHNLPTRGIAVPCSYPKVPRLGEPFPEQCGIVRNRPQGGTFVDPGGDPACEALGLACNKNTCFCDNPPVGYGQRCGLSLARCDEQEHPLSRQGFTCFPRRLGFCYLACDPTDRNRLAPQNLGREPPEFVDSRCGGRPGYVCFPQGLRGICLKFCDETRLDSDTFKQCRVTEETTDAATGLPRTLDLGQGQLCQNFGVQICAWPDDFTGLE